MTYLMSISHKEYQTITFSMNERDTKKTSNNCDAKNLCDTHLKDVYGRICTLAAIGPGCSYQRKSSLEL
jgi:hypothetical protein